MTAEGTIGPVCSICEEYEAIGSLMNLTDYTTTRFCAMCGVTFLHVVLDALEGADTTPDPEPPDLPPPTDEQLAAQEAFRLDDEAAERAEYDPPDARAFPGTANVVRSTHGHRKTGREAGDGQETEH